MKLTVATFTCGLALVSAIAGTERWTNRKMTTISTDEAAVLDVIEQFNNAFAANDVEKYFSYIDSDITVMTPSNPYRVEGIKDDRAEFDYSLKTGASRVGYFQEMQPKVQLLGNTAVVTYYSRGSYGPEGQQKICYYKETDVLARKADGWKIVHIHVSNTR
jgi:ketosteroid isomerase-like protein